MHLKVPILTRVWNCQTLNQVVESWLFTSLLLWFHKSVRSYLGENRGITLLCAQQRTITLSRGFSTRDSYMIARNWTGDNVIPWPRAGDNQIWPHWFVFWRQVHSYECFFAHLVAGFLCFMSRGGLELSPNSRTPENDHLHIYSLWLIQRELNENRLSTFPHPLSRQLIGRIVTCSDSSATMKCFEHGEDFAERHCLQSWVVVQTLE